MDEIKPVVPDVQPSTEPKKDAVENMVVETFEPKKNCRKCHGTGRIGFIEGDPNKPYYCNCIMKVKKAFTPVQSAAYRKAVDAKEPQSTIVVDNTLPQTGVGPCPVGAPGESGTVGIDDSKASV